MDNERIEPLEPKDWRVDLEVFRSKMESAAAVFAYADEAITSAMSDESRTDEDIRRAIEIGFSALCEVKSSMESLRVAYNSTQLSFLAHCQGAPAWPSKGSR